MKSLFIALALTLAAGAALADTPASKFHAMASHASPHVVFSSLLDDTDLDGTLLMTAFTDLRIEECEASEYGVLMVYMEGDQSRDITWACWQALRAGDAPVAVVRVPHGKTYVWHVASLPNVVHNLDYGRSAK